VGIIAGAVNGAIVTRFAVPAIVVTIGTMSLYRGISYIVLGDTSLSEYPADFWVLGQGYAFGLIPYEFIIFLVLAAIMAFVLHGTVIGRNIYAIGNNPTAAQFSGIPVDRYRFCLFTLNGAFAGLSAVLLTSRIGSTRPNIALGWELEVVTVVVLGGVSYLLLMANWFALAAFLDPISEQLGFTGAQAGALVGAIPLTYVPLSLLTGLVLDRVGARPDVVLGDRFGAAAAGDLVDRLMGRKPELRLAFIQQNAQFVQGLDI
jgi:branched-subunit amino acid ABC-type transport system permease component